jgi:translation initiation factor 3 subunit L
LHRLVQLQKQEQHLGYKYLGYFATVTLARLECLLGDYHASLDALQPTSSAAAAAEVIQVPHFEEDGSSKNMTPLELVHSVFAARLSMAYHSAVSYLMLRRYKDATRVLSDQCVYMQRTLFSSAGYFNRRSNKNNKDKDSHLEQYQKLFDRMVALLAILIHACPITVPTIPDSILRLVREKHGKQWNKIEAGEEGYEDLFIFACPKFICPAVPDYTQATTATNTTAITTPQDAYKLQVKHFMNEMAPQPTFRKLRSYMKLYTSISVSKLAAFNDVPQEHEFLPLLLCYKHKMRQLQQHDNDDASTTSDLGTALDIHYFIHNDMVHVDEAEKQRRFENYFLAQIHQNEEIRKDIELITTKI